MNRRFCLTHWLYQKSAIFATPHRVKFIKVLIPYYNHMNSCTRFPLICKNGCGVDQVPRNEVQKSIWTEELAVAIISFS